MGRVALVGWTIVLLAVAGNLVLGFWRVPSLISNRFSLTEPSPLNLAFWSLKRLSNGICHPLQAESLKLKHSFSSNLNQNLKNSVL